MASSAGSPAIASIDRGGGILVGVGLGILLGDFGAWFLIPEGHRFEATQALRKVLSRAVKSGSL